ncbi:MAG: preprotein translocase subunit SecE [Chloroflexota bacterium]
MSAEDTLNEKSRRRRGLRRQAEAEPVDEVDDEMEEYDEDDESSGRGLTEKKGRATRGRRTQEVEVTETDGNFITRPIRGIGEYIEGVRAEMQKVIWPTREETRRLTTIVLSVTIISALVLGAVSFVFNEVFVLGLKTPFIFAVIFVVALGVFLYYLRLSNKRGSSY